MDEIVDHRPRKMADATWLEMVREEHPMPAWAAIDRVQDTCDDRDLCIEALQLAASDYLGRIQPPRNPDLPVYGEMTAHVVYVCRHIDNNTGHYIQQTLQWMAAWLTARRVLIRGYDTWVRIEQDELEQWKAWVAEGFRVLDLINALEDNRDV